MATVFLGEPAGRLDEIGKALKVANPQAETYRASMQEIIQALSDAKLECTLSLRATSNHSLFERLQIFIARVVDLSYNIIKAIGDPAQHFEPIQKASELLDSLGIHITLVRHVEILTQHPVSIEADLNALGPSMRTVMTNLDSFRTEVELTFSRLS
jgi:hypothetical protein